MRFRFKPISSITRGPRDTSMELLRIVAMTMVLVVHADFVALGVPQPSFGNFGEGLDTLLRVVFEMASLVCVNVFILISGWYTIKPSLRGFISVIFQVLFFLPGVYLVSLLFGNGFSLDKLAACFCLSESQWFIKAYVALYLIAPLLNMFAEKATEGQLRLTVILFYVYQTVWGFLAPNPSVAGGYSVFSFMGLYLLARYMRLYYSGVRHRSWLVLYGVMTLLCVVAFFTFPETIMVVSYANPLVVVGALALTMYFTGLKVKVNRWVNFLAASSFAAFLFHHSPAMMNHYIDAVRRTYEMTPGIFALFTLAILIIFFYLAAVVLDQGRIWLWNKTGDRVTEAVRRAFRRLTDPSLLRDTKLTMPVKMLRLPRLKLKMPRFKFSLPSALRRATPPPASEKPQPSPDTGSVDIFEAVRRRLPRERSRKKKRRR